MRSGISLRVYSAASLAAGTLVILNTWMQHEQFYPTLVALANSKTALFVRPFFASFSLSHAGSCKSTVLSNVGHLVFDSQILGNVAIAVCVLVGIGVKQFFLGTLRENEFEVRIIVLR